MTPSPELLPAGMIRVDLHLHSRYSPDSDTSLEDLIARARSLGLGRIALTDHNTAEGALQLARLAPELAIVGEEVKTSEGEIIGLFLTGSIRPWCTPEEACDRIHAMGGLTYMCHPFDPRRASFTPQRVVELADRIDIIETYNQWCPARANEAAARLARELGKPGGTGSDAHSVSELGRSWMEMEEFMGPADFLAKLARARHHITEASGASRRA